jgi:hypothetical protein
VNNRVSPLADHEQTLPYLTNSGRVADYPAMIGEGYADLRDLPLT